MPQIIKLAATTAAAATALTALAAPAHARPAADTRPAAPVGGVGDAVGDFDILAYLGKIPKQLT
ncbi:hypothetical protein [Actinomadura yumaensis]|uniref:Uncharacterized protein n=1 Tax=Actinomadura yumaensis TaxID=111807 RepID=A0ABW2CRK5_9ACTN